MSVSGRSWFCGAVLLVGCVGAFPDGIGNPDGGTNEDGFWSESADMTPVVVMCGTRGRAYTGLGGNNLILDRQEAHISTDRLRMKPRGVLSDEPAQRFFGGFNPPGIGGVLPDSPPHWFTEPQASGIMLYYFHRSMVEGCYAGITNRDARFAMAPTQASAAAECAAWQRKFWLRVPTQAEIDACVEMTLVDTAQEPDPRRRWAYTCATLLSASDYLTY